MKHSVRSFSIGLFTAGIIMLIGIYFLDDPKQAEGTAVEEMIPLVEEEGYRVITEEEYISLSVNDGASESSENSASENTKSATDGSENTDNEEKSNEAETRYEETDSNDEAKAEAVDKQAEVINYTLEIESGMASSSISSTLADNDIIDDAAEFNQYLQDQDYSLKVQIGSYDLSSDMSFYEIAEAITK